MKYSKPILMGVIALAVLIGGVTLIHSKISISNVKADVVQNYGESFTAPLLFEDASTTTATNFGSAVLNITTDGQAIDYQVNAMNLTSNITDAHLHCAPAGYTGQVIVPLDVSSASGTNAATFTGRIVASDILHAAVSCNPNIVTLSHLIQAMREGQIYVNVHTVNYPMGEVRGQLMKSDVIVYSPSPSPSISPTVSPSSSPSPTVSPSPSPTTSTPPSGWYYVFVQPDSYYKIQGSSVQFSGSHFVPGETVTVSTPGQNNMTVTSDSSGNFSTGSIVIPYGVGTRTYTFMGASSQISFPVGISVGNGNPWIALSTYYAGSGTNLTISGQQFGAHETVNISFAGTSVGSATTDSLGNFTLNTTVPSKGVGQWTVAAIGQTTNMTATQSFSEAN